MRVTELKVAEEAQDRGDPRDPQDPADGHARFELGRDEVAIARRLALSARRSIGFLPVGFGLGSGHPSRRAPEREANLLSALALALTDFVAGEVATVGAWRTWDTDPDAGRHRRARRDLRAEEDAEPDEADDSGRIVREPGEPRRAWLVPSQVGDRSAAGFALQRALTRHLPNLSRVLVDLSDYAPPGVVPASAERLDAVVLIVRVRRDRWQRVADLIRTLPRNLSLGVILLG